MVAILTSSPRSVPGARAASESPADRPAKNQSAPRHGRRECSPKPNRRLLSLRRMRHGPNPRRYPHNHAATSTRRVQSGQPAATSAARATRRNRCMARRSASCRPSPSRSTPSRAGTGTTVVSARCCRRRANTAHA